MILAALDAPTAIYTLGGAIAAVALAWIGYKRDLLGLQKATSAGRAKASASEARAAAADAQATALAFAPLVVDLQAKIAAAERKADDAVRDARLSRDGEERCHSELTQIRAEHTKLEKMLEGVLSEQAKQRSARSRVARG